MQVIAVSNRKGGTGKTTVSVNLAAELAARGQRVLLIDLDSQGHCAVGLGITVNRQDATVHDLFKDPEALLASCLCKSGLDNLWLAPADPLFDHGHGSRNDQRLHQALVGERMNRRFDVVVIDTPPSLDALLNNAFMAAQHVLVPFVPLHLSFEGLRQLARALYPVMTKHNRQLRILGFVPIQATAHVRQHRSILGRVTHDFGEARLLTGIRTDIRVAEAMAAGVPVGRYAARCRGSNDFRRLADEVMTRITPGKASPADR